MQLTLTSTVHGDIRPELRAYVEEKIGTLGKYLDLSSDSTQILVELGKGHKSERNADDLFYAEIRVRAPGIDQYVTAKRADERSAFDEARAEMAKVLGKAKDKNVSLMRRGRNALRKMFAFEK